MTKEISLTQGKVALVDDEDYERVSQYNWYLCKGAGTRKAMYASREENHKHIKMHTFITGYKRTDHINRDGLDNRRINLRESTNAENCRNVGLTKNNTTGYKGVINRSKYRGRKIFRARIRVNYELIQIGDYLTAEEAARAYDEAAKKYFGEFAWTNFK